MRDYREQRDPSGAHAALAWVQGGLDGGWIPSREHKGGMEGTIRVMASQMDSVGTRGRHRRTNGETWPPLSQPKGWES